MKIAIIIGILVAIAGAAFILSRQRARHSNGAEWAKSAEASQGLRQQILTMDPITAGIEDFAGSNQVWGVIMETGYPEATVTLVALADGNASLYFSSGGGVIGGVGHEAVRKAASQMAHVADGFVASCSSATDSAFPAQGKTVFYILTKSGKVSATVVENDLGEQRHVMSPLFFAGQDVITQLRRVTNDFK